LSAHPAWPSIDVIIPVHNEAPWIAEKLRNTAALDYPPDRLRIWVVDGASDDGTAERARACIADDPRFRLISVPIANKAHQLNVALRQARAEWVLVTDADARLPRRTLQAVVLATLQDPELGAVGTPVSPSDAHPIERAHWRISNWVRCIEASTGFGSLVMAPCYLFRRALVSAFPDDVVADDVHVALTVAAAGWRVGLAPVTVRELRAPRSVSELVWHKQRKLAGYWRELLRPSSGDGVTLRTTAPLSARRRVLGGPFLCHVAHVTAVPILILLVLLAVVSIGSPLGLALLTVGCGLAAAAMVPEVTRRLPEPLLVPSLGLLLATCTLVTVARLLLTSRWSASTPLPTPSPSRLRGES